MVKILIILKSKLFAQEDDQKIVKGRCHIDKSYGKIWKAHLTNGVKSKKNVRQNIKPEYI